MFTRAPLVAPNKANAQQRALMARFSKTSFTIRTVYTPKLNLNLGMDCAGHSNPPVTGPDFNNDFNDDFGSEP